MSTKLTNTLMIVALLTAIVVFAFTAIPDLTRTDDVPDAVPAAREFGIYDDQFVDPYGGCACSMRETDGSLTGGSSVTFSAL